MTTQLREILYTDSQDMLIQSSTIACTTTTAMQMAAPVPEIMKLKLNETYSFLVYGDVNTLGKIMCTLKETT
jgi:hypothetical protein